ncbi:hypothetical protein SAMN06298216_2789 [Spirosomataceae bacterium TFI 002]|nr:hypothetical protein SAMN06298216_2789 [Spirosomataceae bacterium TFI 002]
MNKIAILILVSLGSFAQTKVRTFDQFAVSYGLNDKVSTTSLSLGQEMVVGKDIACSFGAFARLNWNSLKPQSLESKGDFVNDELGILNKSNVFSLSFPLSASIGFKNLSFGGNFDLASWTFGKTLDSKRFTVDQASAGLVARPKGLSWVLSKEESFKNLSNQLYLSYTFDQSFGIRVGMSSQHITYDLRNLDTNGNVGTRENIFGHTYMYPFISLRFNNEK